MTTVLARRLSQCPIRFLDDWGSGVYHAPRGDYLHEGIDFALAAGTQLLCHIDGVISKLGIVYTDTNHYRYVQVTEAQTGHRHRFFYVLPGDGISPGKKADRWLILGSVQNISERYISSEKGPMINHVHYEVQSNLGNNIDPRYASGF